MPYFKKILGDRIYLSTDLSKEIDNNNKFISNSVELLSYEYC